MNGEQQFQAISLFQCFVSSSIDICSFRSLRSNSLSSFKGTRILKYGSVEEVYLNENWLLI